MKKEQKEEKQINIPISKFFRRQLDCQFSKVEFKFAAGELDVLGYNKEQKCFYISEGKRSSNIASLGHAIGQLLSYMTMIYEDGYDFLNRITKEESNNLDLTDFSTFFEKKIIKVCFYIGLPFENKNRLLDTARKILKKLGTFGDSIGILFAKKNYCEIALTAKPIEIPIERIYTRTTFLEEVNNRILDFSQSMGIVRSDNDSRYNHLIQFIEKGGNPYLHYEISFKKHKKIDKNFIIETAFHLEFQKPKKKRNKNGKPRGRRRKKILKAMRKAIKRLRKYGFKLKIKWGRNWSKIYSVYTTGSNILNDQDMENIKRRMNRLIRKTKPIFDRMNWGRIRKTEKDEDVDAT